jgi:hypothetical protein
MDRYSQLYVERGQRISDSPRARRRFSALVSGYTAYTGAIYKAFQTEVGYNFTRSVSSAGIIEFFNKSELADFLDGITIVFDIIGHGVGASAAANWSAFASRVFQEENLAYRVDANCVVHPFVDTEFAVNQSAALEALNEVRFGEARNDFEEAFRHLRNCEGKAAVRMMFPAVETTAKVLFRGKMSRLTPNDVGKHILPCLRDRYAGNQPAIDAGTQLLEGMKAWIVASQPYRHGQEQEEPTEPPQDFVIAHLSAGAAYLRWMIGLCG